MKTVAENPMQSNLEEGEIIRRITLKISHLFSMKEKQRRVMGEFLNSEVLNFNAPSQTVVRYGVTYRLGVLGDFAGSVWLNLGEPLAEKITGVLFGMSKGATREDMDAAMQELLNIFGGHLATAFNEMGIDFDITTPEPTEDDFMQVKDCRKILFRFVSEGNTLQFILALKPRTEEQTV